MTLKVTDNSTVGYLSDSRASCWVTYGQTDRGTDRQNP